MSYYDNQVAYYDNQIHTSNQRIVECNQKIKQLEDDVEDLYRVKAKVVNVDSAMTIAADGTSSKISNLPSLITNPFSVLKTTFFSGFLDVVKGSEHSKAKRGIENATTKIANKIKELQREIESLKTEIGRCNSNVSSLTRQKSNYIVAAEKKAAELAAKEAADRAATEAAKNTNSSNSSKK